MCSLFSPPAATSPLSLICPWLEMIWLMGAPGSGKGTNTPFILQARCALCSLFGGGGGGDAGGLSIASSRGITASPVVLSDLLDSPEFRAIKAEGKRWLLNITLHYLVSTASVEPNPRLYPLFFTRGRRW